jgi:phenylacetate-CoA ligase
MEKEKLERLQIKSLRGVIENAFDNVPYYNNMFKEHDLRPSDIKKVQDLNKIPVLSKQDIRENLNEMISKDYNMHSLIEYETSGSTGQPLPVYVNKDEDDYRKAKHLRSNIIVGQRLRDKYICVTSPSHYGRVPTILQKIRVFSREFVSVFDDVETQLKKVTEYDPDILAGYSSSLYLLAQQAERTDSTSIRPKFLLGGAELCDEPSRRYTENVFHSPFIDQYAIVELEKVAWQCSNHSEYHLDSDSVIVQFIDKDGEEVSPGERGEIICTSLFNHAMPFIRYSIGDIGIPSNEECDCGITFPTMKIIEGRKDSMLTLPGGLILSPRNFAITVNHFPHIYEVDQWRLIQKKLDYFEIFLKLKEGSMEASKIEEQLRSHMHKMLNMSEDVITFEVNIVEDMQKDRTGKLRAIVSLIN